MIVNFKKTQWRFKHVFGSFMPSGIPVRHFWSVSVTMYSQKLRLKIAKLLFVCLWDCGLRSWPPRLRHDSWSKQKNQRLWTPGYIPWFPHPRHPPVSHMCRKCWPVMILWERPKCAKAPPLDEGSREKEAHVWQKIGLGPQKTGMEGEPTATTMGPGEIPCTPGLMGTGKGKLQHGVLGGCDWEGWVISVPLWGEVGMEGELRDLRGWEAPSVSIVADLEAHLSGHFK